VATGGTATRPELLGDLTALVTVLEQHIAERIVAQAVQREQILEVVRQRDAAAERLEAVEVCHVDHATLHRSRRYVACILLSSRPVKCLAFSSQQPPAHPYDIIPHTSPKLLSIQ